MVGTMVQLLKMTRDGAAAARVAHNHEVPGSSPGPATKEKHPRKWVFFLGLNFRTRRRMSKLLRRVCFYQKRSLVPQPRKNDHQGGRFFLPATRTRINMCETASGS